MGWWMKNNLRMIQNNIRDIDADMDVDFEIQKLKEFGANVLQLGCAGITSFIPAKLSTQRESPWLKRDMFGEMVRKCHENGIRVIARFDVSKTHESFLETNPEWFARTALGEPIRYNDTYATCVNGDYQRKYTLEIIRDAITRYPVDGIFFNAFGYLTYDYSGTYIGICQCESCKRRFRERYGKELPLTEDEQDPVYQLYRQFKQETVNEILEDIYRMVKSINPEIAVSTYNHHMVDIIRNESNSAVDRPYPFWIYASSENVSSVEGSFEDKIVSNCAINAVDLPYRFMGVSKYLNQIRLYGNLANNSGLDWCIIGSFEDYPDTENFETVKEVFHFHKTHEQYYGKLQSMAKILLVEPRYAHEWTLQKEYRGIFKALKEGHRLFRCVNVNQLDLVVDRLDDYRVIILPGVEEIKNDHFIDALQQTKAAVIVTGLGLAKQPELLARDFGIRLGDTLKQVRGSYMLTEPKSVFKSFGLRNWVYLDRTYRVLQADEQTEKLLPLVSSAMYGPPERCFGHQVTDIPSVTVSKGRFIYFPWMLGTLYYDQGYEEFKNLLFDVMDARAQAENPITTNAPNMVEVFFDRCGDNQYLLQLINLTGFNGTTIAKPIVLDGIDVYFNDITPKSICELTKDGIIELKRQDAVTINNLQIYKAYVIQG